MTLTPALIIWPMWPGVRALWLGLRVLRGRTRMPYGWKVTEVDGTTFGGYRWPDKGWVRATNVDRSNTGSCPRQAAYHGVPSGDGLCVAKTWAGDANGLAVRS